MLETYAENALATWTVGQCAFTIEYSLRVIDDIRLSVVDAFFSLPRGGAEIGGILLGRHEGRRVTITDYVPLDCEHAKGPSFVLSPNDHARMADMLAAARGNPFGTQPVGWYHSHTRSEVHLSAADIEIHRLYFPEPWQVALVMKPHTFQPTRAGFFFREADGSIHASECYREFVPEPLGTRSTPDPSATIHAVPVPEMPQPESVFVTMPARPQQPQGYPVFEPIEAAGISATTELSPPERQVEPQLEGTQAERHDWLQSSHPATVAHSMVPSLAGEASGAGSRRNKKRIVFVAVGWICSIAIMFGLGTLVNNRSFRERPSNVALSSISSPVSQPSALPSLALHAKRQNGDLELNWSREPALIASASSGVISIRDGQSNRRIALDSTQVRGGSLLYSPTSDQIVMQLTVTTPAGPITESVMVVLPKVGGPQTYPLPSPKTSSASVAPSQPSSDSTQPAKASKPFREPSAKVTPAAIPAIPIDSPPLRLNLDPTAPLTPGLVSQTRVPPPPFPGTSSQRSLPQQPGSGSIVIRYQPAIPIAKASPVFPLELQSLAVTRKVIEVKVAIDKNGKVTRAEAIPQKNVSQFLVSSAVNAARLWKFQPARRDDEPVSSETLLQFAFGR